MLRDLECEKSKGNSYIEILVGNIWIPVMGTALKIIDNNKEVITIKEIRVRNFKDEKNGQ